jgi:hypothetical protein
MTKTEYAEYLQSDHWKELRKTVINDYPFCMRCTMPRWLAEIAYDKDLHVHHKNYRTRGNEKLDDLEVLCRRCHDLESSGRSELREVKAATCSICEKKHWDRRADRCAYCARILKEGPYGLRKYESETLPGFEMTDGRDGPTWAEIMPYELSGTEGERRIALSLAIENPYLHEKLEYMGVTVAERLISQVWARFGTDQVLDLIADLDHRFADFPLDSTMPQLVEKK